MDKLKTIKILLEKLGMPKEQQSDLCCYAILAMANIGPSDKWNKATNEWTRIHDIIGFIKEKYMITYAENSRETFRKQAIHHFRTAALIEDNGRATNSPNFRYRLTKEVLDVIKDLPNEKLINSFLSKHEKLIDTYASKKEMTKMPVKINGKNFTFSTGSHNELQKAIIEEFAPRFAPNSECLYVGDTIEKDLVKDTKKLKELGFEITLHDKMPDVVLYNKEKNWLYFIESVTSVGPMDPKRIIEINAMTQNVTCGKIFVTAFLDFKTFKRFSEKLAWETEVWLADMPDHMIHLNGDKFLGPRNNDYQEKIYTNKIKKEDLKELPLFLTNREIVQSEISNWLKGDVSLHSMFSYNFASAILPFIQDDQGAAITVEGAYQVLNQKNICFIPFYPELSTNTVFIWKKYTRLSPVIDRFIKKVQEYLEKSRSLYEK